MFLSEMCIIKQLKSEIQDYFIHRTTLRHVFSKEKKTNEKYRYIKYR